jgi:uncharacterized protein (DUF58 family)
MGFWTLRRPLALNAEARVYPNLMAERKRVASVFLTRGGAGSHVLRQVGQGREFEKLREYVDGDAYSDIHWKATAKRARPVTKTFQVERTQEVNVIIDCSRLSAAVSTSKPSPDDPLGAAPAQTTALERFVTAAMVLGIAAQRQGDLFGVMSFSDRVESFVRARNGRGHYRLCRDALYELQPRAVTPDFSELFTFIRTRLRRRSLLVILTNLQDPILSENFAQNLPMIARQHLVLVNMVQPQGVRQLFTRSPVRLDDVYEDLAAHYQWRRLIQLRTELGRKGVRMGLLENESFCADLVSQYMQIKRRQLL